MIFCDSHIHLSHCDLGNEALRFISENDYSCLCNFCFKEEFESWEAQKSFQTREVTVLRSFGIHPQACSDDFMCDGFSENLSFLEKLLSEKKIAAVGECGFDFFTPEFRKTSENQEVAWNEQLNLSIKHGKPIVIHIRKAVEKIFSSEKSLKKIPAVIFHSFPGTLREAEAILSHGVNAYFSFGKPVLNGKKSAIDCVGNLPGERLLFETDAPYQTLKGENQTAVSHIARVYEKAAEIRGAKIEELSQKIRETFSKIMV
ncbi:MAG: TatD family hydrolase [Treponema sp.]|nr:TatD family hydrolase [Treponema sp.]